MPMTKPTDFGTNADGGKNQDYCSNCFQNGAFTDPKTTLPEMIEFCSGFSKDMGLTPEAAHAMLTQFLPTLKRWKK